jgi:hypothetical protein
MRSVRELAVGDRDTMGICLLGDDGMLIAAVMVFVYEQVCKLGTLCTCAISESSKDCNRMT